MRPETHTHRERAFFWELEDSLYNTHTHTRTQDRPAVRLVMSDPAAPSAGRISCQMLAHHPALSLRSSVQPAAHPPTPTFCPGHDSAKTCQIAAPGCCCSLLMTRDKQTLATVAACSVVWQPAKPAGFQGLAFPLPEGEGQKLQRLFPSVHSA